MLVDLINPTLKIYHVLTADVINPDTQTILYPAGFPVTFKVIADCLSAGIDQIPATDYLSCDPHILTARKAVLEKQGA